MMVEKLRGWDISQQCTLRGASSSRIFRIFGIDLIKCRWQMKTKTRTHQSGSSPQHGDIVLAASRKIRRIRMKRDRGNPAACSRSVETHVAAEFFKPTKRFRDTSAVACFSTRFMARSIRKRISVCTSRALKRPLHTTASRCDTPMLKGKARQCSARADTAHRRATDSTC